MYTQPTNDAMMTRVPFIMPAQIEGDFSAEELSEDMDGVTLRFPRAKIPGGGTLQFELTGENPDEPEYAKSIEGVLMFTHLANAYWPEGSEYDDDAPPLCQSVDGKTGSGTPGGMCQDCLLNRFGSDSKGGNGKACKNMRMLYILRSGESLPIPLALPPTSLKGYNDFVSAAFLSRKRGICAGVVQITLKKMTNGPHDYSIAVFKKLYDFTGEQLAAVRELSNGMRMQIKNMNEQRAVNHATIAENICEYQDGAPVLPDNDAHFIPGIIDGERDELPA